MPKVSLDTPSKILAANIASTLAFKAGSAFCRSLKLSAVRVAAKDVPTGCVSAAPVYKETAMVPVASKATIFFMIPP
ncbi:hypothetical protein D3C71_1628900 [compost metagenome]